MFNFKNLVLSAALCCAAVVSAETYVFNKVADWTSPDRLTQGKDSISASISHTILTKKKIMIEPDKKYYLSGNIKMKTGSPAAKIYFGFRIFDKQGKHLAIHHCNYRTGTDTELVEAVKPGDKVIKIKDGSKWRIHPYYVTALNTKKDYSDLPNRNFIGAAPKKITKGNGFWAVELQAPAKVSAAAGTAVRQHIRGGEFYVKATYNGQTINLKNTRANLYKGIGQVQVLINVTKIKKSDKPVIDFSGIKVESK